MRGVLAMGGAMLLVFALGTVFPAAVYPPAELAVRVIKVTPGDFATVMIERLGPNAKRGLALGVNLAVLAAGGLLALWIGRAAMASRKAARALWCSAGIFAGSILLSLGSPAGASAGAAAVYLIGSLVFAGMASDVALLAVLEPGNLPEGDAAPDTISRSRRRFTVRLAWVLGSILAGVAVGGRLFRRSAPPVRIAPAARPWIPPAADPSFPVGPLQTPEITPNEDFYNVDINIVKPTVDPVRWRLQIKGLVDAPYELSYEQLQRDFEVVEIAHTLTCISNQVGGDLISTAVWRGVRLADVLNRAGLKAGAVKIVFRAAEGYSDSITLQAALDPDTLVVFGMNSVSLPKDHGFPARIIVPGIYGMKNVKWVTAIEAVDYDYQGYWMVRGWSDTARVKTESRIDVPADTSRVKAGAAVAGVAWAGDRGIRGVEISQDNGASWSPALLKRELSPLAWRLWTSELKPASGKVRVMVRAVDGTGDVQDARRTPPHPDGAQGYHWVDLTIG